MSEDTQQATAADVRALRGELRNWDRWGAEEQPGTINFITPQKRMAAGRLIRRGKTFLRFQRPVGSPINPSAIN